MLPGGDARRDQALEMALREVLPDQAVRERPDQPDGLVTAVRRVPARDADFEDLPPLVDPRLRDALARRGIDRLYSHQARAVAHALAGRHVVVTTPTASGKTLCYNIPVMNAVLADPSSRALYLFPTKALAQDQLAELDRLTREIARASDVEVGAFTYDGDTPQDARRAIRGRANVVLTNPDMLHAGVLPHHPKWAKLFGGLRYVVIDELHAYRGVFGSHLANVLRRLRRVCEHYGSSPTFICSSATIANPVELAESLAERPFELVAESGAPRGEKWLVFVNPPIVNRQLGIRRSYISQSRGLALEFLQKGLQVIVFAQSRLSTEILTRYLKDAHDGAPGESDLIRGYRGGYLPHRRREIERGLREGAVRGVVSTNALELGIDIGALDVAVLAGYPGTIASTWQRFGRARRRSGRSAGVLVASSAPLDQYVVRHPAYFFDASPEHALVNPDNLQILVDHVKCAAFELPFATTDTFGRENVQDILGILAEEGFVHLSRPGSAEGAAGRWHWTSESYPADAISLRTVSSDNFVVVDVTGKPRDIGETDFNTALEILHEKAIYIVEGRLYQVERLDVEGRKAYVRHVDCDYYTDAITYSRVTP
ncbi:MAG TPA: DEAD/DEAH box helicase, partial [Vicinamibacterales bacterium]|nr:DEAD/DEAH box helicase [Vicinamibacterales bacterium]